MPLNNQQLALIEAMIEHIKSKDHAVSRGWVGLFDEDTFDDDWRQRMLSLFKLGNVGGLWEEKPKTIQYAILTLKKAGYVVRQAHGPWMALGATQRVVKSRKSVDIN